MNTSNITRKEKKYWEKKENFDWLTERSIKKIIKLIPNPKKKVLELAAGSGMFTKLLNLKNVKEFICSDLSSNLIKKTKKISNKIKIKVCDAQKLPFKSNQFDIIYIFAGLHHIPYLEKCLKEIYRCLKCEGVFVCFEPNADCFYRKLTLNAKYRLKRLYTEDETFLKPEDIEKLLLKKGFRNIKTIFLTPHYKLSHVKFLYPFSLIMNLIGLIHSKLTSSFFIMVCKK